MNKTFKRLIVTDDGYFCSICQKYNTKARNIWVDKPCIRMMVAIHGPEEEELDFNETLKIWGNLRKRHILLDRIKKCGDRNRELKSVVLKSMLMHKIVQERKHKRDKLIKKPKAKKK